MTAAVEGWKATGLPVARTVTQATAARLPHLTASLEEIAEANRAAAATAPAVDLTVSAPSWEKGYARRLAGQDFLLAGLAGIAALMLRFGPTQISTTYWAIALGFPLAFVGSLAIGRAYESRFLGSGSEEFRRVVDSSLRLLAAAALVSYLLRFELARGWVAAAFPLAVLALLAGRSTSRHRLHRARRAGRYVHRTVVVGKERSVAEMVRTLRTESHGGLEVVGACIDLTKAETVEGVPVVGSSSSIVEALRSTGADTVAITAWSDLSQDDLRRLSWELEGTGVDVVVAPRLTDIAGPRISIRPVAGLPLLHIEEPTFTGWRRFAKGLMDRSAALAGLLLLAPLFLAVAIAVRATSSGPAFFRQERVGRDGTNFTMFKFRSMRVTAEEELAALVAENENADGVLFKIRKDPRITTVGQWLRKFSIDELPQLINVVKGEMSMVGPRPPLPREVAQYATDVHRRLLVKPGLTGLWQVSGRSDLTWEESVRLDLHYVENWSPALDAVILWKTASAVLAGKGAY